MVQNKARYNSVKPKSKVPTQVWWAIGAYLVVIASNILLLITKPESEYLPKDLMQIGVGLAFMVLVTSAVYSASPGTFANLVVVLLAILPAGLSLSGAVHLSLFS